MNIVREAARTIWPPPGDRHGPLSPLLLALTLVTGLVDAVSYLKLGHVFVANMTGNVVFLGFALAGAHGLSTISSLLALGAFLGGALIGGRLGAREGTDRAHLLRAANIVQVLLIAVALLLALAVNDPGRDLEDLLTVLLACAMGVQNAAARRLAVPDLTTTVLTLTLTGIAADSVTVGGSGSRLGRRGMAVAAMALGALIGGLLVLDVSLAAPLVLALGVVFCSGLTVHVLAREAAPWMAA